MSENINWNIKQYTDDTELYTTVKDNDDVFQFQHNFDTLAEWSNTWQLSFSFSKCKHLQVGNTLSVDYNLMDCQNSEKNYQLCSLLHNEQDFEVWCTDNLKLSLQCQHAVSKAMKALWLIKETFKYFNTVSLSKLYKAHVHPHLKYCVQVQSPSLVDNIDALEKF